MIQIGQYQTLILGRFSEPGAYLTDNESDVLLPNRFVPPDAQTGDRLRVFVYTDSEDRPVATTQRPLATVGHYAFMKCVENSRLGAFVDWGLDKDLLIPFAEQHSPIRDNGWYVVRVGLDDKTGRVYGSTKLSRYFQAAPTTMQVGIEVEIIGYRRADHGMLVVIDDLYGGLVFHGDGGDSLQVGERRKGYTKRLREDGRVAITLAREGFVAATEEGPRILDLLRKSGGVLPYGDRSEPEEIRHVFGMSKATFKKAIGHLMKNGAISIEPHFIRLVK